MVEVNEKLTVNDELRDFINNILLNIDSDHLTVGPKRHFLSIFYFNTAHGVSITDK